MFSTVVRLWILAGVYKELRLDGSILRGGREGLFVSRVTMTARDKAILGSFFHGETREPIPGGP